MGHRSLARFHSGNQLHGFNCCFLTIGNKFCSRIELFQADFIAVPARNGDLIDCRTGPQHPIIGIDQPVKRFAVFAGELDFIESISQVCRDFVVQPENPRRVIIEFRTRRSD